MDCQALQPIDHAIYSRAIMTELFHGRSPGGYSSNLGRAEEVTIYKTMLRDTVALSPYMMNRVFCLQPRRKIICQPPELLTEICVTCHHRPQNVGLVEEQGVLAIATLRHLSAPMEGVDEPGWLRGKSGYGVSALASLVRPKLSLMTKWPL